jgi:hypothetical protein
MRKSLGILGVLILLIGLILVSVSSLAVSQDPDQVWITISEVKGIQDRMSVEGNLAQNDTFMVYFAIQQPSGIIPDVAEVIINVTDPQSSVVIKNHEVPISVDQASGAPVLEGEFPGGIANITGTYKVDAWAIGYITLKSLSLRKLEIHEREPQYPYTNFLPVGAVVFVGGVGISLLGVKSSRNKKIYPKTRNRKRPSQTQ